MSYCRVRRLYGTPQIVRSVQSRLKCKKCPIRSKGLQLLKCKKTKVTTYALVTRPLVVSYPTETMCVNGEIP